MSSKLPLIEHVAGRPSPFFAQETSKRRTQQFKSSQFWDQIVGTYMFNFQWWRSNVQFRSTTLMHSEFQSHARLNHQTEAPKCRNAEVSKRRSVKVSKRRSVEVLKHRSAKVSKCRSVEMTSGLHVTPSPYHFGSFQFRANINPRSVEAPKCRSVKVSKICGTHQS
jgi:hypothetical protein